MLKGVAYKFFVVWAILPALILSACGPAQNAPSTSGSGVYPTLTPGESPQADTDVNGNVNREVETITAEQADLTLSVPKTWEDIAIIHTNSDIDWVSEKYQDTLLFQLCEKTAYTKNNSTGVVWGMYVYTNESFFEKFGDIDPSEMIGVGTYIIGTDAEHVYLLMEPSDVQFLEDDQKSKEQYAQLQKESQAVFESFLSDNHITVNEQCPDASCYQVLVDEINS